MDLNVFYFLYYKMEEEDYDEMKEFLFPSNSQIIKSFSTLTTNEQIEVIKIGMDALSTCVQKYKYYKNGEKDDFIENLKIKHVNQINSLNTEIRQLKDVLRNNEVTKREEINKIKQEIEYNQKTIFKGEIDLTKNKLKELETKNKQLIDEKMQNQKEYYDKLIEDKSNSKKEVEQVRLQYEEKLITKERKIEELQEKLNLNKVSGKKGQVGENWVFNTLVKDFPTFDIIDSHSQGHKGDFIIKNEQMICMLESKNYKKNVAKREITKFYRDIDSNDEYNCAIMLSLETGVCNKPDFCFEFRSGKPILFLHKVFYSPQNIKIAINIFKLVLKNMDCFDIAKEETQLKLREKIKDITSTHKKTVSHLNDYYKLMNESMNKQWEQLTNMFELLNINN